MYYLPRGPSTPGGDTRMLRTGQVKILQSFRLEPRRESRLLGFSKQGTQRLLLPTRALRS